MVQWIWDSFLPLMLKSSWPQMLHILPINDIMELIRLWGFTTTTKVGESEKWGSYCLLQHLFVQKTLLFNCSYYNATRISYMCTDCYKCKTKILRIFCNLCTDNENKMRKIEEIRKQIFKITIHSYWVHCIILLIQYNFPSVDFWYLLHKI